MSYIRSKGILKTICADNISILHTLTRKKKPEKTSHYLPMKEGVKLHHLSGRNSCTLV